MGLFTISQLLARLKEEPRRCADHNKAFCRLVAETFDCPGPVFEFGSYQVEGQVDYADLRGLFPGKDYVGCDMRPGPGVDRVEDVSAISLPDGSAGTVLCIETFEHVFEVRRAFDEVFRILKPGGLFVITSPLNFRIHGYPDDYWRMTPNCLRRMLDALRRAADGLQGYHKFPHSVMGLGLKAPAPADFTPGPTPGHRLPRWLRRAEAGFPLAREAPPAGIAQLYRSQGRAVPDRGLLSRPSSRSTSTVARSPGRLTASPRSIRHATEFREPARGRGADDSSHGRNGRSTAVLGLDGATWTVLDPMRQRGLDAQPRRLARPRRARHAAVVDPAGHDGGLDHHDDRLRPGAARGVRPPLLRHRRRPDEGQPFGPGPRADVLAPALAGRADRSSA